MTVFSSYERSPYRYMDIRCPCGGAEIHEIRNPVIANTIMRCRHCGTEIHISDHLRMISGIGFPTPDDINRRFRLEFNRRLHTDRNFRWEYPQEGEMRTNEETERDLEQFEDILSEEEFADAVLEEEIMGEQEQERVVACMVPNFKGNVTCEECLQCAASGEARCHYDYSLLKYIFSNTQERPDVHVTDITGCLKRAYLGKTTSVVRFPYEGMVLALGQITHGFLEGMENGVVQTEVSIEAMGLKGTVDKLQFVDGGVWLTDFKTTRWLKPSNLPYGSHEKQVNVYARMLREKGYRVKQAFVQYIDLSGPTKCRSCKIPVAPTDDERLLCPMCLAAPNEAHLGAVLYPIDLEPAEEIEEFIVSRRDQLVLALEMEDPPEAEPGWLCKYCPFANSGHCEEGAEWVG